ncbi:MAG: YifB family Mg chelatase-like AAA ATPase [Clostridia bacterium]|nr:YifB family Mg chelatase-like AAA ATPase [Clostridia bacterium]
MYASVKSFGLLGLETYVVNAEVDLGGDKFNFDVGGLPDAAVKESRERVEAAIKNSGLPFPYRRITVNLAPADKKKEGSVYDLPITAALLKANLVLKADTDDCAFLGELSLAGEVKGVRGVLPMLLAAKEAGIKKVYIPWENRAEARVIEGVEAYPVKTIRQLLAHFSGETPIAPVPFGVDPAERTDGLTPDFADVMGQPAAKRALEIAAAGGHNCLMIGPPGSGKSMLAKRLPGILPDMSFAESLETTKIYSVAGKLPAGCALITNRPFRAPHHSVSSAGLSGGGALPRPGEISLAHNGVLFMDELPEFSRTAMELLRQPLEDGKINISRVAGTVGYPCSVMLVAAMNPCPCGYFGHPTIRCTCSDAMRTKYLARVSGPILDRIDIHVEVGAVNYEQLTEKTKGESSEAIRARVNAARERQNRRFAGTGVTCNAKMTPAMTKQYCVLSPDAERMLRSVFDKMGLSARAYDKILRLSRTIADLAGSENIALEHLAEAVQYRDLDRKYRAGEI